MDSIFHEKQEGSLCAQHCLNSLLQGSYFTAVDLSTLALNMDEAERLRMAECGEESEEYRRFIEQPSGNMDDSGYFSVQVISCALEVWGLEIVPFQSTDTRISTAMNEPGRIKAFICNHKDHWFTLRKLGNQWFNLNSLFRRPVLLSEHYLMFVAQLKREGYSIFVVFGDLPICEADRELILRPAIICKDTTDPGSSDDVDLETALKLSLNEVASLPVDQLGHGDEDLQRALEMSLQRPNRQTSEEDEETLLQKAIIMSLES